MVALLSRLYTSDVLVLTQSFVDEERRLPRPTRLQCTPTKAVLEQDLERGHAHTLHVVHEQSQGRKHQREAFITTERATMYTCAPPLVSNVGRAERNSINLED